MTGDRKRLINFVEKFIGTVRFGNDQDSFVMEDLKSHSDNTLVISETWTRLIYCKLGKSKKATHPLKAEKTNTEVLSLLHMDLCGPMRTESLNKKKYIMVGISYQTSVPRSPQQNGVVERRNRTLMEAARTMLIFAKALLFLWAEAVATA
nr:putative LRR receptor-like protein kinase [Tanacetum cinerariifolium]